MVGGTPLVNCPTQPTCLAHLDLCICQLSRRWQPSLALSKMFEHLLRPWNGIGVVFFAKYVFFIYKVKVLSKACPKNSHKWLSLVFFPHPAIMCLIWWAAPHQLLQVFLSQAHSYLLTFKRLNHVPFNLQMIFQIEAYQIKHMLDLISDSGSPNQTFAWFDEHPIHNSERLGFCRHLW